MSDVLSNRAQLTPKVAEPAAPQPKYVPDDSKPKLQDLVRLSVLLGETSLTSLQSGAVLVDSTLLRAPGCLPATVLPRTTGS